MKIQDRTYVTATNACLFVGVASAFGFDNTGHAAWVVAGSCAGVAAITMYFIRHWRTQNEHPIRRWSVRKRLASLGAVAAIVTAVYTVLDLPSPPPPPWLLVSDFVESTEAGVQELADSLEVVVDSSTLRSRQRLELLSEQVKVVAKPWTGEDYVDVDDAESKFLRVLREKIDELRGGSSEVTPAAVDEALAGVYDDLSGVSEYPIVLGYTPLFVLGSGGGNDGGGVRFEVMGASLASDEPSLTIDDKPCERGRITDVSLVFLCDRNLFSARDAIDSRAGTLRLSREHSYNISINVIPEIMGRVRLAVTTLRTTLERQFRTEGFRQRNSHCEGPTHPIFPFNASDGWTIDRTSVDVRCHSSSRSTCNGLRDVTERSFNYSCTVANNGACTRFFSVDGRGSCWGEITWMEHRGVDQQSDSVLEVELRWGTEERIELPDGTTDVQLATDRADGFREMFPGPDGEVSDPWFDVEVDPQRRYVDITPVELDVAMRPE